MSADENRKRIVIYYSYGGNTRRITEIIRQTLETDVAEIKTVKPYRGSYDDVVEQGKREVDSGFMPEMKPLDIDLSQYDVVILGSPVWWYTFAPAMKSFLNGADLSGKTVYPFATNGGWIGHTFKDFKNMCKNAKVQDGLNVLFHEDNLQTSESTIQKWINSIK